MKVAITQRHEKNKHGDDIDVLEQNYVDYFSNFGIVLIPVPNNLADVSSYLSGLDVEGVILSGGNDVSSKLYGGNVESSSQSSSRDKTEHEMIKYCIEKKIPVLGICRGIQFINVYFGGKLKVFDNHPPSVNHEVVCSSTRLGGKFMVNSYHNQGLTESELASPLKIFAKHEKIVEGVYHPDLPIMAIQWHPERESPNKEVNEKIVQIFKSGELL